MVKQVFISHCIYPPHIVSRFMHVYLICTLSTDLFSSLFPHDTLPHVMGILAITAPYEINFKEILLQATAVVAVIQDKPRGYKNKFESYPLVWSALTFGTGVLHLIQINHQPDATVFQFIILMFVYSSTCFGRFPAHHQELNDCSGSLWFYLRIVVTVVLCSRSGRPDHEHSTTITTIRR